MTKDDLPGLARILAVLGETFNETVSDIRTEGYLMGLSDLQIEQVERGARQALKTSKFFPRPAELRELAVGSADDAAEMAWLELLHEVRRVGSYGVPRLEASVAIAMRAVWGTWEHLCATLPNDGPEMLGWTKRFKSAYGAVNHPSRIALNRAAPTPLLDVARDDDDVPL